MKGKKAGNGSGDIDFTSAFLGPQLWDRTYNDNDFNLEYMDLDEFLSENGIPVAEGPDLDDLVAGPPCTPQQPLRAAPAAAAAVSTQQPVVSCAAAPLPQKARRPRGSPPKSPGSSSSSVVGVPLLPPAHTLAVPPAVNHFLVNKLKVDIGEEDAAQKQG